MNTTFDIGLIRVITLEDANARDAHGRIIMNAYPGLSVESRCIPDQPEGIHSLEQELQAIPKILELAKGFQNKDLILVSCAEDPGIAEIKAALPHVRATGGGECAVALASRYGKRVGVLGITDVPPKAYTRMLGENLVGNFRPPSVHGTLDLQTPQGRQDCIATALRMKELGCEVIALGCTGLATIGIAAEIEEATGLPVVDPVLAMGAFASFEAAKKKTFR